MSNTFVVHGTAGHPFENWFPWIFDELAKTGIACYVPQFPTLIKQTYKNWSNVLDGYVESCLIDESTIFISHSLGSIFTIRYFIEKGLKIKGFISVAGFNQYGGGNKYWDQLNEDFFLPNSDLDKIVGLTQFRHCFMSDNDPYLPLLELEKFANFTDSQKHLITGAGHFNSAAGFTKFQQLLALLRENL